MSARNPQVGNTLCAGPRLDDSIALDPLQTPPLLLDTPPLSSAGHPESGNVSTFPFSSNAGKGECLTILEASGNSSTVDKAYERGPQQPGPAASSPSGCPSSLSPPDNALNENLQYQTYDWSLESMTQIPTWLATDDFDINALNAAIIASTNIPALLQNSATMGPISDLIPQTGETLPSDTEKSEDIVCRHWFTHPEAPGTDHGLPDPGSRATVDEPYRQSLTERLQYRVPTDPLPSTDFLWETYIGKGEPEVRSMSQAALIGQVFGYLSGTVEKTNLASGSGGFGCFAVTSRHVRLKERKSNATQRERGLNGLPKRSNAGLAILDSEFADLFLAERYMRRPSLRSSISDDEIWTAPTAADWSRSLTRQLSSHVRSDSVAKQNSFKEYFALEEIAGSVCDARMSDDYSALPSQQSVLEKFYCNNITQRSSSAGPDNFCLRALWHVTFLSSLVDFDRLELAVGREGHEESQRHVCYARAWANSRDGCRCVVHAVLTFRCLESMPRAKEPPIHAPRSLHRAILVLYCYLQFKDIAYHTDVTQNVFDFPELKHAGINCERILAEVNGPGMWGPKPMHSSMLCHCIDLLRRLGHWGLARQQAAMWEVVVYGLSPN
ncbi:similar to An03g06400 [Aspergillus luchuensis]|uniref:Similar to An03g06400 n=1 Tax=Aspergillus kawachii TaxID=1069201 RepID=A0A146FW27_ASPKA|nr:similar to An03g06400 [Aspergillus luchuensis]